MAQLGILIVRFTGSDGARVYRKGRDVGPVNGKIRLPCHQPAFVRVGKEPGPTWLSAGRTVQLACQAQTEVDMSPKKKP